MCYVYYKSILDSFFVCLLHVAVFFFCLKLKHVYAFFKYAFKLIHSYNFLFRDKPNMPLNDHQWRLWTIVFQKYRESLRPPKYHRELVRTVMMICMLDLDKEVSLFSQNTGFLLKRIYGFILKQRRVHVFQTWKTRMTKCIRF